MKICGEDGMKVNTVELLEQRKEEIIKSGHYVTAEFIIGCDKDIPIVNLEVKEASVKAIGDLLMCMKAMRRRIFKEYPELELFEQMVDVKSDTYDADTDRMYGQDEKIMEK